MACFPSGEGAIIYEPNYKPSENGVIVNLQVADNIDSTLERIEENGGKTLKQKIKIEAEGRGYFAIFYDSEGNRLGLYED
jgi:predicted enzyme related to lactoylglutathione lyase